MEHNVRGEGAHLIDSETKEAKPMDDQLTDTHGGMNNGTNN